MRSRSPPGPGPPMGGIAPSSTFGLFVCTMSVGGTGAMTARDSCSGDSIARSSRAQSSSAARGRRTTPPGSVDHAGSAPKNAGVGYTTPLRTV